MKKPHHNTENRMINFENLETFETTAAIAEGHNILVSFTSNRGGYTSRTYRDADHAKDGIVEMESALLCGAMWTATDAKHVVYREPTWAEVTGNGRWSCE